MKFCWHCWHVDDDSIVEYRKNAFCKKQVTEFDHYEYEEKCCRCDKTVKRKAYDNWLYPILMKSRYPNTFKIDIKVI
jgi:hypothetical protein